jgi:glycosyltransferase involved in cell wall biosynthesis
MITTFYPPYSYGGDGVQVYRLSNGLARRGHKVHIIHCIDSYTLMKGNSPKGNFPGHPLITIHSLKSPVGLLSPFLTQQTGRPFFKSGKIEKILSEIPFDVIHYHNMSLIGPAAMRIGAGIKLYTMHEHWLFCPMHVLWKFGREVCIKPSCFTCQLKGGKPPQWWRYSNLLFDSLKHIDCFISPSRYIMEKHLEAGLNIPIRFIPHFLPSYEEIEEDKIAPQSPHNRPYFLYVGRLEAIKGIERLISIFKHYKNADLLIAGDGSLEAHLKRMAEGSPHIHLLGRLPYQRLVPYYRHAISVIVPSLCPEVFGLIVIEAFRERSPVIVHALGSLTEIVNESRGGLAYKTDQELIESMEKVRLSDSLRRELGERGYCAYKRLWSEDAHMEQYLSLIEEYLQSSSSMCELRQIANSQS